MSAALPPTNADLLEVQYGTVPYAVFAVSLVEFSEGNRELKHYGGLRGSDAAEELGRPTLLAQWWNSAAAQILGVGAYRKTRNITVLRKATQQLFAALDPGLGPQVSACLTALARPPQTPVFNAQAILSRNINIRALPCRFIERQKSPTRAGKQLGAFFKLCFCSEPNTNHTFFDQHTDSEPSKPKPTGALATLLLLLSPTDNAALSASAAALTRPTRLIGSRNKSEDAQVPGGVPLLMDGCTPLDTLCLAGLPLCVTIFRPDGRIYHQNAASMEYFGRRTSLLLTGALDMTTCGGGVGPVHAPPPPTSSSPPPSTLNVHPDGYALQELLYGGSNPGPNNSTPGGRLEGEDGAAGDCDVLGQLFMMERGKLEQMLAATLEDGGVWEGIVRVPASLNPDGPTPSASTATSIGDELQSTTNCVVAVVGLGQRCNSLPPIADLPFELASTEEQFIDHQTEPYNRATVNGRQASPKEQSAEGQHDMALPSFGTAIQAHQLTLHSALAVDAIRRDYSGGEESLVQLPTPAASPRASSLKAPADSGSGATAGYGLRGPDGIQQIPVDLFPRRGSSGLMALASPGNFTKVSPAQGTQGNQTFGEPQADTIIRPSVAWSGALTDCSPNPASAAGIQMTSSCMAATGTTSTPMQPAPSSSAGPNSTTTKSGVLLVIAEVANGSSSSVPSAVGATSSLPTITRTGSGTNAATNHARLPWLPRIIHGAALGSRIRGECEPPASATASASQSVSLRQRSFNNTKEKVLKEHSGTTDCGCDGDLIKQMSAMRRSGLFRSFTGTRKLPPRSMQPIDNKPAEGAVIRAPVNAEDAAAPPSGAPVVATVSTTMSSEGAISTHPLKGLNLAAGSSGGTRQHAASCTFQIAADSSGGGRHLLPPPAYQTGAGSSGGIRHQHPQQLVAAIAAASSEGGRTQILRALSGRAPLASTRSRRSHIKRYTSLDPLATSTWQVLFESTFDNSSATLTTDGGDVTATGQGHNNILSTDETCVTDFVSARPDSAILSQMSGPTDTPPPTPIITPTITTTAAAAAAAGGISESSNSFRATNGDARPYPTTSAPPRRLAAPLPASSMCASCTGPAPVAPHSPAIAEWFCDGSSTPRRQSHAQEEGGLSCAPAMNPDSSGGVRAGPSAEPNEQAGDSHTDKLQPLEVVATTRRRMSSMLSCALAAAATTTASTITAAQATPTIPAITVSVTPKTPPKGLPANSYDSLATNTVVARQSIDIPQQGASRLTSRPSALAPALGGSARSATPPGRQSRPCRSSSALQLHTHNRFPERAPNEKLRPASNASMRFHGTLPVAVQQPQQQQDEQHLYASHLSLGRSFTLAHQDNGGGRSPQATTRPVSRTSANLGSLANSPVPNASRVWQFANSLRTAPKSRASGTSTAMATHGGWDGGILPRAAATVLGTACYSVGSSRHRVRRLETSAELGSLVRQASRNASFITMRRQGPPSAAAARGVGQFGDIDTEVQRGGGSAAGDELQVGGSGGSGGAISERTAADGTAFAAWTRSSAAGLNNPSLGSGMQDLELELALELETLRTASEAPRPRSPVGAVCPPANASANRTGAGAGSENVGVCGNGNGMSRRDHVRASDSSQMFGVVRSGGGGGGGGAGGGAGLGLSLMGPMQGQGTGRAHDGRAGGGNVGTKLFAWHEIRAALLRPGAGSGERYLVLLQKDVSAKVEAERHIAQVSECEHRLLEQIFPRHVLAYMTEEGFSRQLPPPPRTSPPPPPPPQSPSVAASAHAASRDAAAAAAAAAAVGTLGADPLCLSGDSSSESGGFGTDRSSPWRPYVRDCTRLATWHEQVTILFADIQGFTPMCRQLPSAIVMKFLNDLFVRFDARLDKYGVYKVETIGDCYVVAGGLIREDDDGMAAVAGSGQADPLQADKVVAFAKAMLRCAGRVLQPTTGQPVRIRVGIHTGPVVSGVVGTRMPRFCLFGDTINTASRMESTGTAGCIHVSNDTFTRLSHRAPGWTPTGGIEVKGKGLMETYLWAPMEPINRFPLAPVSPANPHPVASPPPPSAAAHSPPSYTSGHTPTISAGVSIISPIASSNLMPSASAGAPIPSAQALGGGVVVASALPRPALMLVPTGSSPDSSPRMVTRAAAATAAPMIGWSGVATESSLIEMAASGVIGSGAGPSSSSSRGGPMQWWTSAGGFDSGYVMDISLGPNPSWAAAAAAAQAAQAASGEEGAAGTAAAAAAAAVAGPRK